MSNVLLLSLVPVLTWGLSDYVMGRASKEYSPLGAILLINLIGLLPAILLALYYGIAGIVESPIQAFLLLSVGAIHTLAYFYLAKALALGPISVAAATANSYPLVTLLLSLAFGATFSWKIGAGALVVFIGGALLSSDSSSGKIKFFKVKAFRTAALAALGWGLAFFLYDRVAINFSWVEFNLIIVLAMTLFSALAMWQRKESPLQTAISCIEKSSWPIWVAGLGQSIGLAVLFMASEQGEGTVLPAIIASASPLATSLFAVTIDKEKLRPANIAGVVIIVIGIMLLNA